MTLSQLATKLGIEKVEEFINDIMGDPEILYLLKDNSIIEYLDTMDGSPKLLLTLMSKIYNHI